MAEGGPQVRFAPVVLVREHVPLERTLSASSPKASDVVETVPLPNGGVGTYRTYLSWERAGPDYHIPLADATYEPTPPPDIPPPTPDKKSAAAAGGGGGAGFTSPEPSVTRIAPAGFTPSPAPSRPPPAAPASAPVPAPAAAPPAPAAASSPPPRVIDGWHLGPDGFIYQGPHEHSSQIVAVQGNVVTTQSKSRYVLGRLDERVATVMDLICPTEARFDPAEPLALLTRQQLLFAQRIVFGPAKDSAVAVLLALSRLEADLGHASMVSAHFGTLRSVLSTLGVTEATVPAAAAAAGGGGGGAAPPAAAVANAALAAATPAGGSGGAASTPAGASKAAHAPAGLLSSPPPAHPPHAVAARPGAAAALASPAGVGTPVGSALGSGRRGSGAASAPPTSRF